MQRLISNQACKLYHTAYCDMLNMPNCEMCFVNTKADVDQVITDLNVLRELMPAEGITHLFTGDECVLCKGKKGKRAYYAMLDMGHVEPVRTKRSVIGMKTQTRIGSILPVQIGSCAECKKRIRTLDNLPMLLPLFMAAVMLLLLMIGSINAALLRIHAIMPFAIFAVVVLAGVLTGRLLCGGLRKKYALLTHLDPFEIPTISHMRDKGWFVLNANGKSPKLVFSKKRMRMGVGTGTADEAFCVWNG